MRVRLLSGRLTRSTANAVGYDIFATEDCLLKPQSVAVVGTGIVTEMEGCFALICDRSGLAAKYGVSRRAGVIDPDYRQEWKVVLSNEGVEGYQVKAGDRIAQAVFLPLAAVEVVGDGVEHVAERRVGGLGSTGA